MYLLIQADKIYRDITIEVENEDKMLFLGPEYTRSIAVGELFAVLNAPQERIEGLANVEIRARIQELQKTVQEYQKLLEKMEKQITEKAMQVDSLKSAIKLLKNE